MDFERVPLNRATIFAVAGSMETGTLDRLRHEAREAISPSFPNLLFDLAQVDFIDSSAIGLLIELFKQTKIQGGELYVSGLANYPADIFRILRLDQYIRVFAERAEAEEALKAVIVAPTAPVEGR